MAFDFPASPTEGQLYAPAGGPTYVFRSGIWRAYASELYLPTAETRNRVINGGMQISQENAANTSLASAKYIYDQWIWSAATAGVPVAIAVTTEAEGNFMRVHSQGTVDASVASTDLIMAYQKLEGSNIKDLMWGKADAKPVVLRFKARCAGTISSLVVAVALRQHSGSHSFIHHVTLSTAWQEFVIPVPGPTVGVWAEGASQALLFSFTAMAGTGYQGASQDSWLATNSLAAAGVGNIMAVANGTMDIKDVGFYADPDGTGLAPPWEVPDYATELAKCQRYWQTVLIGYAGSVTSAIGFTALANVIVSMCGTPALTGTNAGVTNFPATVGTLTNLGTGFREVRTASTTASYGQFFTQLDANARL